MAEEQQKEDDNKALETASAKDEGVASQAVKKPAEKKGTAISFLDEFTIFPDQLIEQGINQHVKCYKAEKQGHGQPLIAVLCNNRYTPRTEKINAFLSTENPNLCRLMARGRLTWPTTKKEHFILIYEEMGKPLISDDVGCALGLKADKVLKQVVYPVAGILRDLRNSDLFHGSVRPSNLYFGNLETLDNVILGDCLSLPPGFAQPALYEPIERAMANSTAKGIGLFEDDLYAFAVTVAALIRKTNPLEGLTDQDIIKQKIEQGSFAAIIGRERITGPLLELMRGCLSDDPKQRWTMDDLLAWVDGRRLSPKQSPKRKMAARPITYNDKKFFYPSHLAMEIAANPNRISEIIEGKELLQWIERSLSDTNMADAIEEALRFCSGGARSSHPMFHRMITRICTILDPTAPIRYKGLSVMPDGIGYALTDAFMSEAGVQSLYELIVNDELTHWIANNTESAFDVNAMYSKFESSRGYARTSAPGYGIERCLYVLNPEAPCMSPILKDFFVRSPEDMLDALENVTSRKNPERVLDRHMIAYLSCKERNLVENALIDINSNENWRQLIGTLKVLSTIQRHAEGLQTPALAGWFIDRMDIVCKRFHDREMRKKLKVRLEKERSEGNLSKIYAIVDDPEAIQVDSQGFREAMNEYHAFETERKALEKALSRPEDVGKKRGNEVAAFVCFILAAMIVMGAAVMVYGSDTGIIF